MSPDLYISRSSMLVCRFLAGATVVAVSLYFASYFLVDAEALLVERHTGLGGVGVYIPLSGPLLSAAWAGTALAFVDYMAPVLIYGGIFMSSLPLGKGVVFEAETLRGLRLFAWGTLLVGIQQIAFNTLVSISAPGFERTGELVMMVSHPQFLLLFVGVSLAVLSRIFSEAVELARENQSFI